MNLARIFPAYGWLRGYRREDLPGDLLASVIVTIMLVPQSLAYAMLAELPLQVGLYASILPLVGYALFGSSRSLAVGPVAVVSLMTAAAAGKVAAAGTPEYLGAALALALISGLFLAAFGLLRLGFLANFLSHPVIAGFISASAIIIAVSQFKHILGVSAGGETLFETLGELVGRAGDANLATLAIGAGALALLAWMRGPFGRLLKKMGLPAGAVDVATKTGPVAAVLASVLIVWAFQLHQTAGVRVVGDIPAGLPPITLPPLDPDLWGRLLPSALLIGFIGFVESVSVAQTLAAKRREKIDPNQELVGLGAANVAAAFSGGYPVTGGFARSVVNFAAGARTQLAGVLTAAFIAVAALTLGPLFQYLPNAVLAATIVIAVLGLVDWRGAREIWIYDKADGLSLLATFVGTLAFGVELGVGVGVAASIALYLWRTARPHMAIVGRVPGTEHYRNVRRHKVTTSETVLAVRVDESLYFANARNLEDRLLAAAAECPNLRHMALICSAVNFIDASALESLEHLAASLRDAGVTLHLAEVKGPVQDRLERIGFFEHFDGRLFLTAHEAMTTLDPTMAQDAPVAKEQAA